MSTDRELLERAKNVLDMVARWSGHSDCAELQADIDAHLKEPVEYELEELPDECFAKALAYADVRVEAAFGSASTRAVAEAQYAMVEAIDRLAGLTGHAFVRRKGEA